jgi:hypothetical protein
MSDIHVGDTVRFNPMSMPESKGCGTATPFEGERQVAYVELCTIDTRGTKKLLHKVGNTRYLRCELLVKGVDYDV